MAEPNDTSKASGAEKKPSKPGRITISMAPDTTLTPEARKAMDLLMEELQKSDVEIQGGGCENYVECKKYNVKEK
ncbi:hypothetical protein [Streptomyces pseudogriseolus]|uniref:hypothetical protein n=1 Tax=Streptomyces pseudogriseolus TaxID=36817 RepID=UPI003FA31D99